MSKTLNNLELGLDEDLDEKLSYLVPDYSSYRILRKSVDARKSRKPHFVMSLEVFEKNETPPEINYDPTPIEYSGERPIIIGAGAAGLFAAIRLVERGIPCLLLERGSPAEKRILKISRYWRYGELDENDNVCFGEGGAGLFSDGKLITRIKSPHIPYVMDRFVQFGAPEEIKYLSNPHVGSDKIRRLIPKMREYLLANNCEIRFNSQVTEIITDQKQVTGVKLKSGDELNSPHIVLATGHSEDQLFYKLLDQGIHIEGKSFALGLRIEHPQSAINKIQYRDAFEHPALGAANYKLAYNDKDTGLGVYSFCMCPGGYVLSAGTSNMGVVCNGMSNYNRNSKFANSAIVLTVDHQKLFKDDVFGGLKFREALEQKALKTVTDQGKTKELPAQKVMDFLSEQQTGLEASSSLSGVVPARLDQLLPEALSMQFAQALEHFHSKMKGFIHSKAMLHGVESRTSCPIRITRDPESLESLSHRGLYPTGEGAGYAGGITSAACDGIRVAESIVSQVSSQKLAQT